MTTSPLTRRDDGKRGRLSGRVALVTGAGTGIGRAAAIRYAQEGASLVLTGRRDAELQEVARLIEAEGGQAIVRPTDVANEDDVKRLITTAVDTYGRLDIAFNNAGIVGAYAPIEQLDAGDFDEVFAINVRGTFLMLKYEIAAMRAAGNGGAIVNTSSIAATGGTAGISIYAASKAAIDAMIRPLALEAGPDGIRINNVSPGVTRTPITTGFPDDMLDGIAAHTALKRLAEPEDIADVAVWLSSDDAGYVTGQSILADGGFNIPGAR